LSLPEARAAIDAAAGFARHISAANAARLFACERPLWRDRAAWLNGDNKAQTCLTDHGLTWSMVHQRALPVSPTRVLDCDESTLGEKSLCFVALLSGVFKAARSTRLRRGMINY
jgi:hypothetical protein